MSRLNARQLAVVDALQSELSPGSVLVGGEVTGRAAGIWRSDTVQAPVLVRPDSTAAVSTALRVCSALAQPVITHGGLTGLAEGALTGPDDVVLSTERLQRVYPVDTANRTLLAAAGVTLQAAQAAAEQADLMLALDLGARGSCTLGGVAATNAGGHQVLRYGMAREQILGIEAVLADGTVLTSLNSMLKNNAGYDLKQLFIGTEGTLGIITRVRLRLRPRWRTQETALLACDHFTQVTGLLAALDESLGGTLSAFEVLWKDFYQLVSPAQKPLEPHHAYYVLAEALGSQPATDAERFTAAIADAAAAGLVSDAVVCKSGAERAALWAMRDSVERTLEHGPASIFDVSLAAASMESYVARVRDCLRDEWGEACRMWVFGHAGDGNLHIVVAAGTGDAQSSRRIERCVYEPLGAAGGSISGEHGIGLEKKRWLPVCRTPAELDTMRRLKRALDPANLLNPGRVIDLQQPAAQA
ncbi:MAG: FAD-binding oxidoreductase [Gammaproteobacteria bacterium]|jgi:FAD/FMN-containing dehydrogenase|nr:FAD-binding oxidoreductase [Gammaproteobacteria bacterium]